MRGYLKFVFRSRKGLLSYLAYLGLILAGEFAIYMIILLILSKDSYLDCFEITIYENFTPGFAAIAFTIVTERLLRISVNGGVSRAKFIFGTGIIAPLFAAVTAILTEAAFLITHLIYSVNSIGLFCFPLGFGLSSDTSRDLDLDPRIMLFNIVIIFFITMVAFAAALIFIECRHRLNSIAEVGLTSLAGIYAVLCSGDAVYFNFLICDIVDLDRILFYTNEIIQPEKYDLYAEDIILPTYPEAIGSFIVWAFVIFLISYLIFIPLMKRVPVRGNYNGGEPI